MCWIQPSRTSAVCGELFLLVDLTSTLRGWSLITEVTYSHLVSFWEVSFIINISWQLVILIFPVTGTFLYWQSTFGVYWEEGICLSFVKFKDLIPFAYTLLKIEMILGKYSFFTENLIEHFFIVLITIRNRHKFNNLDLPLPLVLWKLMTQWNLTHTSIHRYWINLLFLWSKGERCFYFLEQGVVIQSDSLSPTGVPVWMSARPLTWPVSGHPRWMLHWSCMSTPCLENWPLLPLYFTLTKSISQRQFFPMKSSHVCKVCYRLIRKFRVPT